MGEVVYLNGRLVAADDAEVGVFDRLVLYGEGLFETMRVYGGKPFALGEHLERLCRSAEDLELSLCCSPQEMREAVLRTIEGNGIAEGYVRLTVSGGTGDVRDGEDGGSLFVYARDGLPYGDELYERGVQVVIAEERGHRDTKLSRHKTTSYMENVVALRRAHGQGAEEALFLTADDEVAEGTRSNVFAVMDGVLTTPPLEMNILPGITRAKVLEAAKGLGMRSVEKSFLLSELARASEVFITSSLMELMPAAKVGDVVLPECPGPVTEKLSDAYGKLVYSSVKGTGQGGV